MLSGRNITEGLGDPKDLVIDAAIGGAMAGVAWGIGKLIEPAQDAAYRYVGPGEAEVIQRTGIIPNVDIKGRPKPVSCTPNFYKTAAEAEEGLLIGRLNPTGPTASPTHRVIFDRNIPHWTYAGNSATSTGIEMITTEEIPILRIDPLGR